MRFKHYLLMVALPFALIFTHSYADNNDQQNAGFNEQKPYLVEVISPEDKIVSQYEGESTNTTPFLIAQDLGATPDLADRFSFLQTPTLSVGGKITLYRAPQFTIIDGKRQSTIKSWKPTVSDILDQAHVPDLAKDDKVAPPLESTIQSGATIKITRVAITQVSKTQNIDYKVVKKDDPNNDKGKVTVKQKGVKGAKLLTYEVRREDGIEVSRRLIKTDVTSQPTDEIQLIGTRPVITVRCKYNDTVIAAAVKYSYDANKLCNLMMKESNGHPDSVAGGGYTGLFQYDPGFWSTASAKAGYSGASIFDPTAQIYTTAWAFTHGYAGRW